MMNIVYIESPEREEIEFLDQKLMDYNCAETGGYRYEDFIYKTMGESGDVVAGIHGETGGGWLYIVSLWVDEKYRDKGLGARLLHMAESTGKKKGCIGSYLYSYNFQNPGFYEKYGYNIFGELDNFCDTHTKLFLKKRLA